MVVTVFFCTVIYDSVSLWKCYLFVNFTDLKPDTSQLQKHRYHFLVSYNSLLSPRHVQFENCGCSVADMLHVYK